jgi:sugar phosphate isomerase/epimerase
MQIGGIGIDAKAGPILEDVASELAYYQECGFDIVELSVHDLDLVLNGRLQQRQLDAVLAPVRHFPFEYTVHSPDRMNLAFNDDPELEKDVFAASLEFSAAAGARVMVYHSGLSAFDCVRWPGSGWPNETQMLRAQETEAEALSALLPLAARYGMTVGMENTNYRGYEEAQMRHFGLPTSAMRTFFPALYLSELVRQLERVDHPNLGLTLDVGHLFTSARPCGFDYLEAIREAAPHIRHLHISDNFGRPEGPFRGPKEKNSHGEGDLHLPPGWGDVPLASVFQILPQYAGALILELRDRYRPHYREARDTVLNYLKPLM